MKDETLRNNYRRQELEAAQKDMTYFTSDQHFGHTAIIRICSRPFANAETMNEALIANWNRRVRPGDTVYICGDLIYQNAADPECFLERLRGKKYLLTGNQEHGWLRNISMRMHFAHIAESMVISHDGHRIFLCHKPVVPNPAGADTMVYGHLHNHRTDPLYKQLASMENALNAGADINAYMPVTFQELSENNLRFRQVPAAPGDRQNGPVNMRLD